MFPQNCLSLLLRSAHRIIVNRKETLTHMLKEKTTDELADLVITRVDKETQPTNDIELFQQILDRRDRGFFSTYVSNALDNDQIIYEIMHKLSRKHIK